MLKATPKTWVSWDFVLVENDVVVGEVYNSLSAESSDIHIGKESYKTYRENLMSGAFILALNDAVVASAEKPRAFSRSFTIDFDGRKYILQARSRFFRKFVLMRDTEVIGSISPVRPFTRRSLLDLPEDIPLPVRAFMFWLVLILWKRAEDASAALP